LTDQPGDETHAALEHRKNDIAILDFLGIVAILAHMQCGVGLHGDYLAVSKFQQSSAFVSGTDQGIGNDDLVISYSMRRLLSLCDKNIAANHINMTPCCLHGSRRSCSGSSGAGYLRSG